MTWLESYLSSLSGEILTSILIMVIIALVAIFLGHKVKKADPLKAPTTSVFIAEKIVGSLDSFVEESMGKKFVKLAPYFGFLVFFIPFAFLISLFGFPSVMGYYSVPFTLALITFCLIHYTAIKKNKFNYFSRFLGFIPKKWALLPLHIFFIPINLLSALGPLISMSFRLLGNSLAGFILMRLFYELTGVIFSKITGIDRIDLLGAIIAPILHLYFDLFIAFIQTLVFVLLTSVLIVLEVEND